MVKAVIKNNPSNFVVDLEKDLIVENRGSAMIKRGELFQALITKRQDTHTLIKCMEEVVSKMLQNETSSQKPGILLGKIQSGKTRAFIGVVALAFDNKYDVSIILTKGTKVLVKQTIQRIEKDFDEFICADKVEVFDVMVMPNNLTAYERKKKLIIIVKKEVNNMSRILKKLAEIYPDLREKKVLIIDDEADYASVSFRKHAEAVEVGRISSQIDELRNIVKRVDYLQVTATPYSLYLQPSTAESGMEFLPKRPAFTVLVPIHKSYIGGDFYFQESKNENSVAYNIFKEVSPEERNILKGPDARRFKLEDVLVSNKIIMLRKAIINFIVGAVIRRLQQNATNNIQEKYAFVAHSEIQRNSHAWQYDIISKLLNELSKNALNNTKTLDKLINNSYIDIKKSLKKISGIFNPSFEDVKKQVSRALIEEHIMITTVNSDKEVEELLDQNGQLKLRNPMNIFIGGQILDRGVTINNLIGFYYGRNPKRPQQDTVLQHSRMYGARPIIDLAVTRFYTTRDIYEVMMRINEFDSALREAFEKKGNTEGVYFIRKDVTGRLVPCSPNKLLLSSLTTLRPYKRMLPIGFQTKHKTHIVDIVKQIDKITFSWFVGKDSNQPTLVVLEDVVMVVNLISKTLELNNTYSFNWNTLKASMEHLSRLSENDNEVDKIWVLIRKNRELKRVKKDGKYGDAPDTPKQEGVIIKQVAIDAPALMLFRQNGKKTDGWMDSPFWWPVFISPRNTKTTVFAEGTIDS